MLSLIVMLWGLLLAQEPTSATYITAAEVESILKDSIARDVVDQKIKDTKIPGGVATVAMLYRHRAETSALIHDQVTEIYQIMEGGGTLVTGGSLTDVKPNDLTRVGAGPSRSGTHVGGESRHVGPKDVIIVPAGTAHRFSALDGPIKYLVYRFAPGVPSTK
jgi:mannose-6-phosphate isomerase-like protein (cupin superfamily)